MTIFDFDIKKGIYRFEFNDLNAESHSHPVTEIVNATHGTFSLESNGQGIENLVFAIIDANTQHKLVSQNCTLQLLMVETHNLILPNFFKKNGIDLKNGVFLKTDFAQKNRLFSKIKTLALEKDLKTPTDKRIQECIEFIQGNEIEYTDLIISLSSRVFLSDSRLSHLFKEHVGVSIKKYLVWNKLRQAINQYLNTDTNLTDVSLQSGFFDQAHLSNSFKNVLGVSPSTVYNSRILQS